MKSRKRLQKENKPKEKLLVILGPNASGKSDLAIQIAKRFDGEIISADSRQVYKGLDIGSGKITKEEMKGIPHYLINVINPKKVFTVADFQKKAKKAVKKIISRGKLPVVAGGTGFYIDALVYDLHLPFIPPQTEIREKLEKISEKELLEKLRKIDPKRAESIDGKNKRRLIRALEIVETTGEPVPELSKESPYDVLKIGIRHSDDVLKKRIHDRLLRRIEEGMIQEVEDLHRKSVSWNRLDNLGLEYRYVARYLQGFLTKEEMIETLEREISRYAKRQMTWFKKDKEIIWIDDPQKAFPIVQDFLDREVSPSKPQ